MIAAQDISKMIEGPDELEDGTLEMTLFLTQKAISDLKELHQKSIYNPMEQLKLAKLDASERKIA